MSDLIAVTNLSKTFVKPLDLASRLANLAGAQNMCTKVHALDDVTLDIKQGEVLGIVGESGCGKSTLGRVLAGIHNPTKGQVFWDGQDISTIDSKAKRQFQLRSQMIFQDPSSSLNPRKRIEHAVSEAAVVHGVVDKNHAAEYADEMLRKVGFDHTQKDRYPHQFSGGQRQRIGIARALAVQPRLLVCDESIAALDVSIQAQVINLFMDLKEQLGLTYAFISHDLSVVRHIADRVAVMYLGRVVEIGTRNEIFETPQHPYTKALLAETPQIASGKRKFSPLMGEVPSPLNPPSGCHFHPRCSIASEECGKTRPSLSKNKVGTKSACILTY